MEISTHLEEHSPEKEIKFPEINENKNEKIFRYYESGHFVDTLCVVGQSPDQKIFKVHRVILAKASHILENMLYNSNMDPEVVLRFPEIEPEIFELLLNYIYIKALIPNTEDQVLKLYKVAHRFDLQLLKANCRGLLKANLNERNVCKIYQSSVETKDELLNEKCRDLIADQAETVLQSESFTKLPSKIVLDIIKRPMRIKSELTIFEALLRWRRVQGTTTQSLFPCLPHIHFLSMTVKEFFEGPEKSGILCDKDVSSIKNYLLNQRSGDLPEWCSKRTTMRHPYKICSLDCPLEVRQSNWCKNLGCNVTVQGRDIRLNGIGFDIENNNAYYVYIPKRGTLIVTTDSGTSFETAKIKFSENTGEFRVLLDSPLELQKNKKYEILLDVSKFSRSLTYLNCKNVKERMDSVKMGDVNLVFHGHGSVSEYKSSLMNIHRIFYNFDEY
ncbi:BTB/POZ domain-containing protein 3-like [Centruroides vittatus]|uniref:BTB/POZ domain-containing protein 3-like n=1 Tax=Centruroides vittatus TaxID=120091 RepID=UPI00350EBA8C